MKRLISCIVALTFTMILTTSLTFAADKKAAPENSHRETNIKAARALQSKFENTGQLNFDIRIYSKGTDCDIMHVDTSNFLPTMMDALAQGRVIYGSIIPGGINIYATGNGFKDIVYTSRADNSFKSYGKRNITRKQISKLSACTLVSEKTEVPSASIDKGKKLVRQIHRQYAVHTFYSEPGRYGSRMVVWLPAKAWKVLTSDQKSLIVSYVKSYGSNWGIGIGRIDGVDILSDKIVLESK